MILYLDTSALVKLYVRERGRALVRKAVAAATQVATSRVAYPEARAAFARRRREGALAERALRRVVADLDRDLPSLVVVEAPADVARRAGDLAQAHALRGFDAIHLACALELARAGADTAFLAFDARLAAAARSVGLREPGTTRPPRRPGVKAP
ncbi:MAG: type II toxin-antitoxin system VapC family toxin [Deltaproteobacteria bacterium]|nr:type II toxin-antitoxin system VapC family toxin [Deltaproteobacteria bacterium]